MKTIYKYGINSAITMPKNATVVAFKMIDYQYYIWAEVDLNEMQTESRLFKVFGTGSYVENHWKYIATDFSDAPYVWHLFEEVPPNPYNI